MRRLVIGLLMALASISTGYAQQASSAGPQLVANNVATADAAANSAPLAASPLGGSNQSLALPHGFSATVVASGLRNPRFMAFDAAGNLLVADAGTGNVYRYPAAGGSIATSAQPPAPLLSNLNAPSNVALFNGYLYVGETTAISRYTYDPAGDPGAREVVVPDLPTGGHSTRTVAFGPDGMMYVGVGSSCNICNDSDPRRAAVSQYAPDGTDYQRFAYGTRNPVGLAFQPGSGLLWATVNERDNQGNEIPPDLVTILQQGENFGWPTCQPPNAVPQTPGADCSGITPPTVAIQAHSAPLGLAFYTGQQFPSDYDNDLFVVQHGSWNRTPPAEPKLIRVHFDGGQPVAALDFATGWQQADGSRWGRPAGVVVAPDGSLLVSDDQAGVLYHVAYTG
ncbi:MAG: PQQ-dependent sugar dehydrogenase [Chloroflexi bacterium]|nr:PQQ-dependent sugar dehydrogenase [Chloroflexota bacterium]